jgi:hypothetical protein
VSVTLVIPSVASAEIVLRSYSPTDKHNGTNVSPSYDITSIETGIESDDPDKIYFWIQFANVITASQFVWGAKKPNAAIWITREDPSTSNYAYDIKIESNSKTPFSGNTGITAEAFGNTMSGGAKVSLSSCNPRVWSNLDQRASWIGFSISRSCADIPNQFWITGFTDADLGNDSTPIIDYDFSDSGGWYVDISEADYIDSEEYMELEPQTITFYQAPDIALSKKVAYLKAFSDSGLDIEFTSSTPKVCVPLNWSNVIRLINTGTCKITANQEGDESYDVADPVSMSFKITKVAVKSKVVAKPTPVPVPTKKAPGAIGGKTKN